MNKLKKNTKTNKPAETPCYAKGVAQLKEMIAVQCTDGMWNHDPYMLGMANGMIFALSLFEDGWPECLDAPEVWLKDVPCILAQ
jgi:hypothetical protein